jgi:hypothetical protein
MLGDVHLRSAWAWAVATLLMSCGSETRFAGVAMFTPPAPPPRREATPKPTREIATLMFDIGYGPPDANRVSRTFMTASNSVRMLYRAASYGKLDFSVDVLGPYVLPVNACLPQACCGPGDESPNAAEVSRIIAELPKSYDHYFWVYGSSDDPLCSTWSDTGSPAAPARYGSFARLDVTAVAQEIGHNLGMEHEHALHCGGATSWADDPRVCTTVEYGSYLSFMGIGTGHPSGFHKAHQGWLPGCNVVNTGSGGVFTLLPLGRSCDGAQLLQVPAARPRSAPRQEVAFYYVELRTSADRDTARIPTVVVYAGPEITSPDRYAEHTFLLKGMTMVGHSFQDPAGGLTITVEAIGATGATVRVSGGALTGSPVCSDGRPFTAPGPDATAACAAGAGGSVGSATGTANAGGAAGGAGGAAGAPGENPAEVDGGAADSGGGVDAGPP